MAARTRGGGTPKRDIKLPKQRAIDRGSHGFVSTGSNGFVSTELYGFVSTGSYDFIRPRGAMRVVSSFPLLRTLLDMLECWSPALRPEKYNIFHSAVNCRGAGSAPS